MFGNKKSDAMRMSVTIKNHSLVGACLLVNELFEAA
jgi:hypothetical protein